jgi:probable F420-dependent oxidoreductase
VSATPEPRFSLTMFGFPFDHYAPAAQAAEAAGFEALWLADHLVTPTSFALSYPYADSGDPNYGPETPLADVWVLAGHLAAVTSTINLASGVYLLPLRNPFSTAKAVATAQALSGGRIWLGIGTGWMREEFDVVGAQWEGRGSRTDEILDVLDRLWTGRPVAFEGRWYSFDEVQMAPAVDPRPPVVVGGVSKRALDRAATRGDAWLGPRCTFEEAAAYRDDIVARLDAMGRAASSYRFYCRLSEPVTADTLGRARDFGIDHLVVSLPRALPEVEQKLAWIDELAAAIEAAGGRMRPR